MELESILRFLENKTILVTGATGFLAKIFVEKILRIQPNVKMLYLLVRTSDTKSASQRLGNEIIGKDLFRVLREKWGATLDSFIFKKVTPVPGDISHENLGIKDSKLMEEIWRETEFVLNFAATTNFDERYDVALGINTFGALHVLSFAKKCIKLKVLLHVSTAYVCGERGGHILEIPFSMEETLNGTSKLDINAERELVEEYLNKLQGEGATEETITSTMMDLGMRRAKLHGWPNTYVYTKAMGEMFLGHFKENLSLVIIRPTMVVSTYKEPFPGWIEGLRTIDSVLVGYGKGKLKCFPGYLESIFDVIPADMVVNCMMVAMVAHANQSSHNIYLVGSSLRNPLTLVNVKNFTFRYFNENPLIDKNGYPIKIGKGIVLSNMAIFRGYMAIRFVLPLKGLYLANKVFGQYYEDVYADLNRKMESTMRLAELYQPYVFFEGIFDDSNSEKLRMTARESGVETHWFEFDPKGIDWEDYLMNTHLPGLVNFVLKK